jgi:hypothetical protein
MRPGVTSSATVPPTMWSSSHRFGQVDLPTQMPGDSASRGMWTETDHLHTRGMSENIFTAGTDVITTRGRGKIVDARATHSGKFVFGVEDDGGEVTYFTEKGIQLAQS